MALVACAACVALAAPLSPEPSFSEWKAVHGKRYASAHEEAERASHFAAQLAFVAEQNGRYARGESSWYAGANDMSDLSDAEFRRAFASVKPAGAGALLASASPPPPGDPPVVVVGADVVVGAVAAAPWSRAKRRGAGTRITAAAAKKRAPPRRGHRNHLELYVLFLRR